MGRRNPNGYGCVTFLKGNRKRPWVVKVTMYDQDGKARQKPVGYAETESDAKILLAKYNDNPWDVQRETVTLVMLFNRWKEVKATKLTDGTRKALCSSFRHMSKYYGMKYRALKSFHMQDTIDHCGCGSSTQSHIKNLWWHLDRFAFELNIIDKMYSQLTTVEPSPETSRTPFRQDQIDLLWKLDEENPDPWIESVLIYIYTGFRLTELLELPMNKVNLSEWTIYLKNRESLIKRAFPVFFVSNLLLVQRVFHGKLFQKGYSFPQLFQGLVVVYPVPGVG